MFADEGCRDGKTPERFVGLGQRGLRDARGCDRVGERLRYLEVGRFRRGLVIEPDVNRKEAFGTQGGEKAGADQRGLAESGHAEEHGERLAFDAAKKLLRFGGAPVEIFRVLFGEGF